MMFTVALCVSLLLISELFVKISKYSFKEIETFLEYLGLNVLHMYKMDLLGEEKKISSLVSCKKTKSQWTKFL